MNPGINYKVQVHNKSIPSLKDSQLEAGYFIFDESKFLHWEHRLLNQWIDIIKNCDMVKKEEKGITFYNMNEITHVGLLEAAVWMVGGIAISEQRVKLKEGKHGRLDLWMKFPETKNEQIEAKYTTNLKLIKRNGKPDKYDFNFLKRNLAERAKKQIPDYGQKSIIIFLTLNFAQFMPDIKDNKHKIQHLLKIVTGQEPYENEYFENDWDIIAWCFPSLDSDYPPVDDHHPGITMFVKAIQDKT
jgi:hypothetical protein